MIKKLLLFLAIGLFISGCKPDSKNLSDAELKSKADELAHKFILVDTHIDVPELMRENYQDLSTTAEGEFDYPRAVKGGLNVPFMSVYIPAEYQQKGGAKAYADTLIDMVEGFTQRWPEKFAIVKSVADVNSQFGGKAISLAMGMENGAPIEGDLNNLKYFYDRGIRYITLTHSKNNHICDSSYDTERKWYGLSPFGKKVVAEMNRLGIMIDISHVSDSTFYQVMQLTKAPVIASHSSCRYFTPGWERNMSDEMIKLLAEKNGVIQINFGSSFLKDEIRVKSDSTWNHVINYLNENNLSMDNPEAREYADKYWAEHKPGYADVTDVADHIDHVVKLVGIDHVGIGSDFDGVGDSLPTGLKDVSYYPNLIYELLKRDYSEDDIQKICSGNILRVWKQVENISRELQSKS